MKKLYSFTINKKTTVIKDETSLNEKGETVIVKKSTDELVPQNFCLAKPSRSQVDEGRIFYAVQLSRLMNEGLITNSMLANMYSDKGGVLSEAEKVKSAELYKNFLEKQAVYERLDAQTEKTEEQTKELATLMVDLINVKNELQKFELQQASVFEDTAESHARNRIIIWWVLNLANKLDDKGNHSPFFVGKDYKEKLQKYYDFDEKDDEFDNSVIHRFVVAATLMYLGRANSQEDFEKILEPAPEEKA